MIELFRARRIIIPGPREQQEAVTSGRSRYQRPRPCKLSAEEMEEIQRLPANSLRAIGEEYGVSHETVRTIRRLDNRDDRASPPS